MIRFLSLLACTLSIAQATPLEIRLPTENDHLFTGKFDQFYMYVDRTFEGQTSKPWEAGSFGLVRNMVRINGETLCTKFHEGIDICPLKRDSAFNPLDLVCSIAAGRVVYVSDIAGRSNYGKYVVIEHTWENTAVYSLYAHFADISCKVGDPVVVGTVLGKMGYTGAGIDRTRAHCHLELGLMMSSRYEDWHKKNGGGTNYHSIYNGMNLAGADVARFFIEQKANPALQFSEFVTSTPAYFKVTIPAHGTPDFLLRYPWLAKAPLGDAVSWEISFSATGLPLGFAPSIRPVTSAQVTSVRPSTVPHSYLTRGLVTGEGNKAVLSNSGKQLVSLLTGDFPLSP
jgi:murein DD-endopeptidase MepM/ murein hydrolase activator NlpD